MNRSDTEALRDYDPIEAILKEAAPRPVPPIEDEAAIRRDVRAEWQHIVGKRRGRRRLQLAAAGLVAALGVAIMMLPGTSIEPLALANIEKSDGTIYLLGEHSELVALPTANTVYSGQVIQTGRDGLLGLNWGRGGSLRIDHDTRIEFIDAQTVFVHRGRVYFESEPESGSDALILNTGHGSISHLGTQYMADVAARELVVSVREGRVMIAGDFHEKLANAGQQVRLQGRSRPEVVDVSTYGDLWAWTESLSPRIDLDNRSAQAFLEWVGRQTGYRVVFDSPAAEQLAVDTLLVGRVEADPRTELRLRMLTTDLEYTFNAGNGTIHIRIAGDGGR